MKKSNLFLVLGLIGSMLFSCSEREVDSVANNDSVVNSLYLQGYVYPLSKTYQAMHPVTKSGDTSFENDWENKSEIYTFTGEKANLPWANVTDSNIPSEIAKDIKKADGWQILLHTFANTSGASRNMNYMFFYNIRTGILKVFYYKETTPQANNTGVWELSFTNPHHMFNATKTTPLPADMGTDTNWGSTNLVNNETKGFLSGWNCFQVLLTYDPNENASNRDIEIKTHNLNRTDVNLFCNFVGYSNGTIIAHGNSNPLSKITNKIATLAGKQAEKWINDNMGSKVNAETRSAILAMGASAIVKAGLNKLFDNFTATLSKPTETRSDLQFTTNTTGTIEGDLTFTSTSPVMGLRALFSENLVGGKLGTWNLATTPSIYIDPRAGFINSGHDWADDSFYRLWGSTQYNYNVVINPRLTPYIVGKSITHEVVRGSLDFPYQTFNAGNAGSLDPTNMGLRVYYDKPNKFQSLVCVHGLKAKYGKLPPAICVDTERIDAGKKFSLYDTHLRITVELITEIAGKRDTTVSTRTFVPRIEWDPRSYEYCKNTNFAQFDWYSCPPEIYQYKDNPQ